MKRYTFTVFFINAAGYNRSTRMNVDAFSLEQAEKWIYDTFRNSELIDENPVRLESISKLKFRDYTGWLLSLIGIILDDNKDMTIDQVALGDYLKAEFFDKGIHPAHVYHYVWEGDAGYYFGI